MTRLLLSILLLVGSVVPVGCAGSNMSPTEKLKRIAYRFNENLRWQRFEHASKNVHISKRELWVAAQEQAAHSLRIVEYEMRPVLLTETISILELDISFYRVHDHVIAKQRRRQIWKNKSGSWQLQSDKEHVRKKAGAPVNKLPDLEAPDDEEDPA